MSQLDEEGIKFLYGSEMREGTSPCACWWSFFHGH